MKFNVRKKLVNLAVASAIGGAAVLSMPAHAVNVSQNNVGEVLLFPYYTVKNGFDSIFTVTNTSDRTVVIKVRWREALNSREVRDFNVVLSPYDVWTAGVTMDSTGNGALVRTYDKSCTSPALPASATHAGATEVEFTSIGYDGSDVSFAYDNGGTSLTRVQEGYFEVFNMGEFAAGDEDLTTEEVAYAAKHVAGVPRDCSVVANSVLADYNGVNSNGLVAPTNVLKGTVSYIAVATGNAVDATPTAIEDFSSARIWAAPGDLKPDLGDGDVGMTANHINNGTVVAEGPIAASQDAVTALLMANNIVNEFATGTGTFTDWVITFPSKHHYTDGVAADPFGVDFTVAGRSCNDMSLHIWNREEGTTTPSGNSFSPAPTGSTAQLCYESNVLTFNGSNVFGTGSNHQSVSTSAVGNAGWTRLTMTGTGGVGGYGPVTVGTNGLPAIGFAAIVRTNSAEAGNNRNYGSSVAHAYEKN